MLSVLPEIRLQILKLMLMLLRLYLGNCLPTHAHNKAQFTACFLAPYWPEN